MKNPFAKIATAGRQTLSALVYMTAAALLLAIPAFLICLAVVLGS